MEEREHSHGGGKARGRRGGRSSAGGHMHMRVLGKGAQKVSATVLPDASHATRLS